MPGSGSSRPTFDAVHQLARLAGRGHEVIPAPRDVQPFAQPEDAVRDGITMMMVVEEPAIEPGLTQSFLDRIELHISADSIPAISRQMPVALLLARR